jgi:hypothetical protein
MGQIVTVEVELPANHGFGRKCIHCQGAVTRVSDAEGDSHLVALRVNYMDFRSFHDRLVSMRAPEPISSALMA